MYYYKDVFIGKYGDIYTHDDIDYLQSFHKKIYTPTFFRLKEMFPEALPLMKKNLQKEVSELRDKIQYLEIDKRGANEITIGFIEGLQEEKRKLLNEKETQLNFFNTTRRVGQITENDIMLVKQIPIRTFIKVNGQKKAICLFHNDKNASMHIYDTTYHCFTCEAHGTTIDIIMKLYNLTFIEAVKKLL